MSAAALSRRMPALGVVASSVAALGCGAAIAQGGVRLLAAGALIAGLVFVVLTRAPQAAFLGWLVVAPFVQNPPRGNALAWTLNVVLYVLPSLFFLGWTLLARTGGARRRLRVVDLLPFAFVALSAASILLGDDGGGVGSSPLLDQLYRASGIGVVAYYFVAFGPVRDDLPRRVVGVLLGTATAVGAMALVEARTGWNLWHGGVWHAVDVGRVVGPLANPAVLGTFLGMAIVVAVCVLVYGPRGGAPRLLALAALFACVPALYLTYARSAVLAAALATVALLAAERRTRVLCVALAGASACALALAWGTLTASPVYEARVANASNVQARVLISSWSLELASRRPLAGYGYGSFDATKRSARLPTNGLPERYGTANTSHDTFLTVLVELGVFGLAALVAPFLVIGLAAFRRARHDVVARPVLAACLAVIVVYVVNAAAIDMRFFSFVPALAWVALGLARRELRRPGEPA